MNRLVLQDYFLFSARHQKEHKCTGVPYEYGEVLGVLSQSTQSRAILEVGTGVGYTAACLLNGKVGCIVDTIEESEEHVTIAKEEWKKFGLEKNIRSYVGKAEEILRKLTHTYDMIFFDANTPQKKFLPDFERLLKQDGLLITTNLFLKDAKGGKYLAELTNERKWRTAVFSDTALSVRVS